VSIDYNLSFKFTGHLEKGDDRHQAALRRRRLPWRTRQTAIFARAMASDGKPGLSIATPSYDPTAALSWRA
jgi:hypothetical protein